jgi:RES domain-containing protein
MPELQRTKIWRICRERHAADAFSGEGARLYGGRWNSRGVPMVYASTSLALAAIELFVHLEPNLIPVDLVSILAELPEGEHVTRWDADVLPSDWWGDELGPVRELGDEWIRGRKSLALWVPSVPIRQEWNVLVNPLHPRIAEVRIEAVQPFVFDARMFAGR